MTMNPRIAWLVVVALLCARAASGATTGAATRAVEVRWLDPSPPAISHGVSWGVPWPRGAVAKEAHFRLTDAREKGIAVQSWPMAYWRDGLLKGPGPAVAGGGGNLAGPLNIAPGEPASPPTPLKVNQTDQAIEI